MPGLLEHFVIRDATGDLRAAYGVRDLFEHAAGTLNVVPFQRDQTEKVIRLPDIGLAAAC